MKTGRRKDSSNPPPPPEDSSASDDELLTSEDLFGDMVDEPAPGPPRAKGPAAARKGPVKVQVPESPVAKKLNAPMPAEILPEEVAALLDAFSEPGEAASRADARPATAAPKPAPRLPTTTPAAPVAEPATADEELSLDGLLETEPAAAPADLDSLLAPQPSPPAARVAGPDPTGTVRMRREDMAALLGDLGEPARPEAAPPAAARPAPAQRPPEHARPPKPKDVGGGTIRLRREALAAMLQETPRAEPQAEFDAGAAPVGEEELALDNLLEEEHGPAPPAPPDPSLPTDLDALLLSTPAPDHDPALDLERLTADLPKPTARKATKFQASGPRIETTEAIEERVALDLAALAEDALADAHPTAPEGEPAPLEAPLGPGEQAYGPYRLLRKLAVGGMAEVFKAKRSGVEGFEKVVAVKRILPHLSDNKEFVDMFINEAKMVAGLTHPNIVQIFDLGKIEKSYYIAMEHVHGRDLRTIMKRARERGLRIPLDLSVHIVSKVSSALEYAHRKKDDRGRPMRIVHRDISPQNILISFEGDVKLTDFGIAKAATKASTTDAGALRGKLLYMSPEQAWGKPMDRRSDVFSLGIVSYELVTEQKPFLASSEMSILEMVRECRVAPPRTLNPRLPERLEAVVMKALDKDPEHRYQDASEFHRDLERVLAERKPPTAGELARFLEILFDEEEREMVPDDDEGFHDPRQLAGGLEVELDTDPSSPKAPAARASGKKDASVDDLLKRFGIE